MIDEVLGCVEAKVTSEVNFQLSLPFSEDEVFSALSQMAPLKSPGPDGFPVIFFQKYWHLIGSNITTCVLDFLNLHRLPHALNYTFIVLIPKIAKPSRITEFRPISLCNIVYKISAKALANRLKTPLDSVTSPTQSAFVPGRLIMDNTLVAYEVNHHIHCHTQGKQAFMALKLDVSKAYDRVEWLFLEKILAKLGFIRSIVDLIMLSVSSVSYSFLLNGSQFGYLIPRRGIRQGDPLSPYLFIYCVEGFIQMINAAVGQGRMKGIQIAPSAPVILNLCFADDTVLFTQATIQEPEVVRSIMNKYAAASGQVINMEKSTMVFSPNARPGEVAAIQQILPFQVVEPFDRYLGLPARIERSKVEVFNYLKDRLWSRVNGWNGREVLIKSVLQAIPTYVMSCFKLPSTILEEVEKIIRKYWWGSKSLRGISWMSWARLCRPKSEEGIGFRNMESFNLALLAKQAWRITTKPEPLLSRILEARYFPNSSFFVADLGDRPSQTWRSNLLARPHLEAGLRKWIGNGEDTHLWGEAWLISEGSGKLITTRLIHSPFPDRVRDLIDWEVGAWDLAKLSQYLWPCDVEPVLQVPIGTLESTDNLYWFFSKHGKYTVRSCYYQILQWTQLGTHSQSGQALNLSPKEWRWLWGLQLPLKVRTFLWHASTISSQFG